MLPSPKRVIHITIFQGRNFIPDPNASVYIQITFHGKIMTTLPAKLEESPEWYAELAWATDAKTLHFLKTQRAIIKLEVFSIKGGNASSRIRMGYTTIDTRSIPSEDYFTKKSSVNNLVTTEVASDGNQAPTILAMDKWLKLFMNQTTRERAELHVQVLVKPFVPPSISQQEQQTKTAVVTVPHREKVKPLRTLSIASLQKKSFSGKVSFVEVENSSSKAISFPYYQIQPSTSEDIVFKIAIVIAFSDNLHCVESLFPTSKEVDNDLNSRNGFYFYYSLLDTPFKTQMFANLNDPSFPATINTFYIKSSPQRLQSFIASQSPLHVYLCRGDLALALAKIPLVANRSDDGKMKTTEAVYELLTIDGSHFTTGHPLIGVLISLEEEESSKRTKEISAEGLSRTELATQTQPEEWEGSEKESGTNLYRYKLGVDIHGFKVAHYSGTSTYGYVRFFFPAFGPSAFHVVKPSFSLLNNAESILENGYCGFEVYMDQPTMRAVLQKYPLCIEIWDEGHNRPDSLLLQCKVYLVELANSIKKNDHLLYEDIREVSNEGSQLNGSLQFSISLDCLEQVPTEDWATLPSQITADFEQQKSNDHKQKNGIHASGSNKVRSTSEYQTAYELEMWKKKEQRAFLTLLSQREKELLKELTSEWNEKKKAFVEHVQTRLEELQKMEQELTKISTDLELREASLKDAELANIRYRHELERAHDKSMAEGRDSLNRIQEEFNFKNESLNQKYQDLQNSKEEIALQKKAVEERYKHLLQEFEDYRIRIQQQVPTPSGSEDILLLQRKNMELERELRRVSESQKKYKQRWVQALEEVSRMRKERHEELEQKIQKEQHELERIRQQYREKEAKQRGTEETPVTHPMADEQVQKVQEKGPMKIPVDIDEGKEQVQADIYRIKQEIQRLTNERTCLLSTGVYFGDDDIIKDITKQIQDLKAKSTEN